MTLVSKKILGIDITISSEQEILEEVKKYFEKCQMSNVKCQKKMVKPFIIFTPNPEIINFAQKDGYFKQIVNTAQINLPDGAGVVWAAKKLYKMKLVKIPGADFMMQLVKLSEKESLTVGLIGGRGDLALRTLECLRKKHPKLSGWAAEGPEMEIPNPNTQIPNKIQITNDQIKEIADKIIKVKIDILFVAFGFPKQEYFINQLNQQLSITNHKSPIILMAVGGSFDYISGRIPRAPIWMRNVGLEWLFRLIREPWRLPRQLAGAEFFWRVAKSS